MKLRDVMTRDVQTIPVKGTIRDAATIMSRLNVGFVPVVEDDKVVGVLTDRDIAVRCVAEGHHPETTRVSKCMSADVVACPQDTDVKEAARLMEDRQIRRLIVVDDQDRLVGVVSLGDVVVDTHDEQLAGEILEEVSKPVRSQ